MNVSVCNHNLKPWTPTHQSKKAEKNNLRTQILKQQTNKDRTMVSEGGRWPSRWPPILGLLLLLSLDGCWRNHKLLRFWTEREFELHVFVSVSGDRRAQTHHSKDNNFTIITVTEWPKTWVINCSALASEREREQEEEEECAKGMYEYARVRACLVLYLKGRGKNVNLWEGKNER